ncbi:MAG: hypothetical protein HPY85_04330 [Anaerolineae bacterium]|nr:hypothetical protein [Anaerolineae bacterium]
MAKESIDLLVEWMREQYTPDQPLIILTTQMKFDAVQEAVHRLILLPSDALIQILPIHPQHPGENASVANKLDLHSSAKVILPGFYNVDHAKFIEGGVFPKIQDNYKTIKILWQLGFRVFELYSYHGVRLLKIPYLLDEFINLHKGHRAFIVGNGPSLNEIDMSLLQNEITFGSNRCYLGFDGWGYQFTYWGIVDRLQIEHYQHEYEDNVPVNMIKFFPFQYLPLFQFENACPVPHKFGVKPGEPAFASGPDMLYLGWSVSYFLIQIAAIMGCNPIYLVGMDHNYSLDQRKMGMIDGNRWFDKNPLTRMTVDLARKIIKPFRRQAQTKSQPAFWRSSDASHPTHFDQRYTQGEDRFFVPPRPVYAEQAYRHARHVLESRGVTIFNATPGSALHEFEFVDFENLF